MWWDPSAFSVLPETPHCFPPDEAGGRDQKRVIFWGTVPSMAPGDLGRMAIDGVGRDGQQGVLGKGGKCMGDLNLVLISGLSVCFPTWACAPTPKQMYKADDNPGGTCYSVDGGVVRGCSTWNERIRVLVVLTYGCHALVFLLVVWFVFSSSSV